MAKDRGKNGKKVSNSETPKTDDDFIRIQKKHFYAAICFLIASLLFYQLNQAYSVITKVTLVQEWIAKSKKKCFTVADISHWLILMVFSYFARRQKFCTKFSEILTHKSNDDIFKNQAKISNYWPIDLLWVALMTSKMSAPKTYLPIYL